MNMPSLVKPVSVLLLAGALLVPGLSAADATLIGDAYVSSSAPTQNFGGAATMAVSSGNVGLVQFDLSAIPFSATIAKAYLRLYLNKVTTGGTLNFALPQTSWSEGGVTFNNLPATSPSFTSAAVSVGNTFLLVDVTAQAQAWLAVPAGNFGIEITSDGTASVLLDTKENTATSHPATLELAITGPAGTNGATGASGATGATGPAGATGATGPKGVTGASGPSGAVGAPGAQGPVGAQGPTGATGATGAAGVGGGVGPTGPTGPAGPTGASGVTGSNGPTGPSGPTGPNGAQGTPGNAGNTGSNGPTGPIGPSGAAGPTSNQFAFDTTAHASGYTVPDTDTFMFYLMNNNGSTPAILNLPHATVKGRVLIVMNANLSSTSGPNVVQVNRQGTDLIFGSSGTSGVTSLGSQRAIYLYSDGAGKWLLYN